MLASLFADATITGNNTLDVIALIVGILLIIALLIYILGHRRV